MFQFGGAWSFVWEAKTPMATGLWKHPCMRVSFRYSRKH